MRLHFTAAIVIATFCIAACEKQKSPEAVARDIAAAQQKASTEVANSENAAAKDLDRAADKVGDKVVAFNSKAAQDAYNLAVANADGDRKVALAKCESAGGDAQKTCKDQAEADFSAAKAMAAAQSDKQ